MGVAAKSRSSFTMSARKGVDDFAPAPLSPSNENVPRGLDDMSSEFTGTNRRATSANTAAAAAMLTAAKAANCTRSPCTMPAVAHAAGGKMAASCPVSWAPSALNAARSSDWPDSANEPNTAASVAASVSTMTATFACLKREDTDYYKEKHRLMAIDTPPFYGVRTGAWFLATLDGVTIDTNMHPCDENGDPIEGLYLTGNDSGGFFSVSYPNLLTGLACGRTMTFGRRAGMLASTGQA